MTVSEAIKELHKIRPRGGIIPQKRADALEMAIQALEEVQQYRAIGTPEECRAAVEKQKAKKPIMKQYFEDLEDECLCCPTCGEILTDRIPADNKTFYFHCMNCGQKFDWSDEECATMQR